MSSTEMVRPATGVVGEVEQGFGSTTAVAKIETAGEAVAAQAAALVNARYVMALQRPRDWDDVRVRMLKACRRPGFADVAIYEKPVGGSRIKGLSVRFAEEAAREMGNLDISTMVVYDDPEKRIVRLTVTDLERNLSYPYDVTIEKTVERSSVKPGQVVLRTRQNSQNRTTFVVVASDDDLQNKQGALLSKARRNCVLCVLPGDIQEECREVIEATRADRAAKDPEAERKKLADGFATQGVPPSELKEYLGHDLATCSAPEITHLRSIYTAIRDGETTWHAVISQKREAGGNGGDATTKPGSATQRVLDKATNGGAAPASDGTQAPLPT